MVTQLQQLILEAKRLQRLQSQRNRAKRKVRELDAEIKLTRKHIKALKTSGVDPDDQLPASWKGRVE